MDKLLELNKIYEEMRNEALKTLQSIKPKVKNITDAQIIQQFLENKDFYWKHDLSSIKQISQIYKINISKLEMLWKKYTEVEEYVLTSKKYFEQLGLENITFGPMTLLSASGDKESEIYIYPGDKDLDIRVYPKSDEDWTKDFEEFSEQLKKRIQNITQKDI